MRIAARCLAIDRVAAEVITALRRKNLPSILLKGASTDRWLYQGATPRGYVDVDLLVAARDVPAVESILTVLGFAPVTKLLQIPTYMEHARVWRRESDGMEVDLHRTLIGAEINVDSVFELLSTETETMRVGGAQVDVLQLHARAMVLVLHAAQHGRETSKPLADLTRALDMLPDDVWRSAAALACRLDASEAFAAGLRLLPAGSSVAADLDLAQTERLEVEMAARTVPYSSWFVARFARTPGLRGKLALLGPKLVPSPDFMRAWYPVARRGKLGLLAAYLFRRPVVLVSSAGPAIWAWWRARRAVR